MLTEIETIRLYMNPRSANTDKYLITFSDFLLTTHPPKEYCNYSTIKLAFSLLDTNASFYLTAESFYNFAMDVGILCDHDDIKERTKEFYDFIDFSSFYEIITGIKPPEVLGIS